MDFEELLEQLKHDYLYPESGNVDRNGHTRLAKLQAKYKLSSLKIQKLLVTAGVYEPVKRDSSYYEIRNLAIRGYSTEDIMAATGLSKAVINACFPYERGAKELDKLGVDITGDAKRKRKQRGKEDMRKENAYNLLQANKSDSSFWNVLLEYQGEVFITTGGERYTYTIDNNCFVVGGKSYEMKEVLSVLHNGLELMAQEPQGPVFVCKYLEEKDFKPVPVLPYIFPILVQFDIIDAKPRKYIAKRNSDKVSVCSCCGRKTDNLHKVSSFVDLVDIAKEEESIKRSAWSEEKRKQVEKDELSMGRDPNYWNKRRGMKNSAIDAYNEKLHLEGDQHLCSLCANTIRMALEEDDIPKVDVDVDYSNMTLEELKKRFKKTVQSEPSVDYTEYRGRRIKPNDFGPDVGEGGRYLFKFVDARGEVHFFILGMWSQEHNDGDCGLFYLGTEIHRLTKAGKVASDNTITDYEIGHSRIVHEDDDKERNIYIGFLELEDKIKHRLQNLTLKVAKRYYSNSVYKGDKCYTIDSIGQFETVNLSGNFQSLLSRDYGEDDYGYMIDGMVFTGSEMALLMSCYAGIPVAFQEGVDDLKIGDQLVPVRLTENELINETIELINMFSTNGRFERLRDKENFSKLFDKNVLSKLKLYHRIRPLGYGKLAGMEIIKRLALIEGTEEEKDKVRAVIR